MSISLDSITALADTTTAAAIANQNTSALQNSLKGVSADKTEDELLQVCKDFESYFVEEVLKEVKENMKSEEDKDKDQSLETLTDFHMDGTIELIADEVVEQVGESFTQQLFEQMKRNYGIE